MAKVFCLFLVLLLAGHASAQEDSSKHLFKPGTLVGKFYGTYDTSAKKEVLIPDTKVATNIQQSSPAGQKAMDRGGVSQIPRFQVNQNFDPIEVSGTQKAGGISTSDNAEGQKLSDNTLSDRPPLQINQNYDPIEVSGTTKASGLDMTTSNSDESVETGSISERPGLQVNKPVIVNTPPVRISQPYRDTRLGSSSPMYNTYRSNDNGAGSITTNPNKSTGSASVSSVSGSENTPATIINKPEIYRDTRLGSSSPMYNTYRTNDNGAGAITTNPNKTSGGMALPNTTISIQPEQTASDTTSSVIPQIRTAEKRSDSNNK